MKIISKFVGQIQVENFWVGVQKNLDVFRLGSSVVLGGGFKHFVFSPRSLGK